MLISCAVTAQLICAFVFTYAGCWLSDSAAQINSHSSFQSCRMENIMKTHTCNIQTFFEIKTFQLNFFEYFLIFSQNRESGYMLKMPHVGVSTQYLQSMF